MGKRQRLEAFAGVVMAALLAAGCATGGAPSSGADHAPAAAMTTPARATAAPAVSPTSRASSAAASQTAATADPVTDELIGAWYHPAPGWWWFLRAGDPTCVQAVRTHLDCVVWQRGSAPRELGIATMSGGDLNVAWRSGFCTSRTSTYSVTKNGDSLNLVDIGGGCDGGNFALTRAGIGSAPAAPPPPAP
jgi:hypothetical protein